MKSACLYVRHAIILRQVCAELVDALWNCAQLFKTIHVLMESGKKFCASCISSCFSVDCKRRIFVRFRNIKAVILLPEK